MNKVVPIMMAGAHLDMTVGFAIQRGLGLVALVRKQKPAWQHGLLNGIGGKINHGEAPLAAQRREFKEETGQYVREWRLFCTLYGRQVRAIDVHSSYTVHFLSSFVSHEFLRSLHSAEKEEIIVEAIQNVNARNAIPNLPWLLRMAIDVQLDAATAFQVHEQYAVCSKCEKQNAHPDYTFGSREKPEFYCENCGAPHVGLEHRKENSRGIYFHRTQL